MQVIKQVMSMLSRGVKVYYITGNHDEMMRRFEYFALGDFHIENKLVLHHQDGSKSWVFHGDVFDVTMKYAKWMAKLGSVGYNALIHLNSVVNFISRKLGKGNISLSKKIKNSVKSAVKYINAFEQTAATIAIEKGYTNVICGHIHQPCKRVVVTPQGSVNYINSGDWVENLTALECKNDEWKVYHYYDDSMVSELSESFYLDESSYLHTTELFKMMMQDFEKAS